MHHSVLFELFLILAAAVVAVPIAHRLRANSIIGFLIGGFCIGPFGFGLITEREDISTVAELGVVFLLFMIGLELSRERLRVIGGRFAALGLLQILVSMAAIMGVLALLDLPLAASLVIAGALALSSTAIILKQLSDDRQLNTRFGRAALAILLVQDVAVGPFLIMVQAAGNAGTETSPWISILLGFGSVALLLVAGRYLLPHLFRYIASLKNPELFAIGTLFVVLAASTLTEVSGLSMALGAFIAGVMLAETEFRHQIEADIAPFRGVFLSLFFMSVGMSVNANVVYEQFGSVLLWLIALLLIKTAVLFVLSLAIRFERGSALRVAMSLAAGGEFAFVMFALAAQNGAIPRDLAAMLIPVVALSMALTPTLINLGHRIEEKLHPKEDDQLGPISDETEGIHQHVLVIGSGRVGRVLARLLKTRDIPFIVLDSDAQQVSRGRAEGLPVFFADGSRPETFRAAHTDEARIAVVAMGNPHATEKTVALLRQHYPHLKIFARAQDITHIGPLSRSGADAAIPEVLETGLRLSDHVLSACDVPQEDIDAEIAKFRRADMLLMNELAPRTQRKKSPEPAQTAPASDVAAATTPSAASASPATAKTTKASGTAAQTAKPKPTAKKPASRATPKKTTARKVATKPAATKTTSGKTTSGKTTPAKKAAPRKPATKTASSDKSATSGSKRTTRGKAKDS
ncbi:cation:proton antiporter domain-containing protein [Thalassospira povalilytica]|uniref:cation:proton antiporter domain-containing protein n=1 Tax=Thalassospira povalilytica TaxID=732237 RepID=UPI001D18F954|nr:cation:proton antiporter [Thalassospira povalilytica]MCC4239488.1 cation:proton antiporter [Thalassospira povalilytica]